MERTRLEDHRTRECIQGGARSSWLALAPALLAFTWLSLASSAAVAQGSAGPSFEIEGAAQIVRLHTDEAQYGFPFATKDRLGYRAGLTLVAPLSAPGSLSLRTGIFAERKGGRIKADREDETVEITTSLNTIGVPILLSLASQRRGLRPFIEAGPEVVFVNRAKERVLVEDSEGSLEGERVRTSRFKQAELGLRAAVGLYLPSTPPVRLALAGTFGLTTIDKSLGQKSRSFALSLGTPFPRIPEISGGGERSGGSGLRWGPVVGVNVASIRFLDSRNLFLGEDIFRSRIVGRAGAVVRYPLADVAYLRSGLLLEVKGSKAEFDSEVDPLWDPQADPQDPVRVHHTLLDSQYYLTVPALVGVESRREGIRPYLHAGPFGAVLLETRESAHHEGPGIDESYGEWRGRNLTSAVDLGIIVGGGLDLGSGGRPLHLDVEYEAGLYNLNDSGNRDEHAFHSRALAVSMGIWL